MTLAKTAACLSRLLMPGDYAYPEGTEHPDLASRGIMAEGPSARFVNPIGTSSS